MHIDALSHRINVGRRFGARIKAGDAVFQTGAADITALPFTVTDGESRQLSGANLFVLMQVMKDRGWKDSRFFTVDQIQQAGWAVSSDVKRISLQYLVSTGKDGLPLEVPEAKRFQVINASEIEGVSPLAMDVGKNVLLADMEVAVTRAGAWVETDGLKLAVHNWLFDLQKEDFDNGRVNGRADPVEMTLRSRLASSLLEVQIGSPFAGDEGAFGRFDDAWAKGIEDDPLSFFGAARDAERLAAQVMGYVRAVAQERGSVAASDMVVKSLGVTDLSAGGAKPKSKGATSGNGKTSARVEALFLERQAVLAVPFKDKDKAGQLGAVWYGPQKIWFVPKGVDVELFREWNPRSHSLGPVATRDVLLDAFMDAMADMGLDTSKGVEDDGQWHYVSVDTKKGQKANKSGSYILSLDGGRDGGAIGTIINRDSGDQFTWKHEGELLTPEQRARKRAEALEREAVAARELAEVQEVAAVHAKEIWAVADECFDSGYVVKKGIPTEGLRQVAGSVLLQYAEFCGESGRSAIRAREMYTIVPMMTEAGELRAVQAISPDGAIKSFMRGAQKKGTMMVLGASSFDALAQAGLPAVVYAEGVATGASFRLASGLPVVVCFDAGNLETVVEQTAGKMVGVPRVVAVDNDQFHVERALGLLSDKMGLNPHSAKGEKVRVASGADGFRLLSLGEVLADGEWHQVSKGSYCVSLKQEGSHDVVRSVLVEIVPVGGRKMSATFENRGVEAGRVALAAIELAGECGMMVVPEFKLLAGRPTDWNDLHQREGVEAVRAVLRDAGLGVDYGRELGKSERRRDVGLVR